MYFLTNPDYSSGPGSVTLISAVIPDAHTIPDVSSSTTISDGREGPANGCTARDSSVSPAAMFLFLRRALLVWAYFSIASIPYFFRVLPSTTFLSSLPPFLQLLVLRRAVHSFFYYYLLVTPL